MKRGTLNLIASLVFLLLIAGMYYYFWSNASSDSASIVIPLQTYTPVEISSVMEPAAKLVQSRQNNASIPIPDPSGKMGKTNPFNDPE